MKTNDSELTLTQQYKMEQANIKKLSRAIASFYKTVRNQRGLKGRGKELALQLVQTQFDDIMGQFRWYIQQVESQDFDDVSIQILHASIFGAYSDSSSNRSDEAPPEHVIKQLPNSQKSPYQATKQFQKQGSPFSAIEQTLIRLKSLIANIGQLQARPIRESHNQEIEDPSIGKQSPIINMEVMSTFSRESQRLAKRNPYKFKDSFVALVSQSVLGRSSIISSQQKSKQSSGPQQAQQ